MKKKPNRKIIIPEKDRKRIQTEGLVQITEHLDPKEKIESSWGRIRQGTWLKCWKAQIEKDQTAERTAIIVTEADGRRCLYATPAPDLKTGISDPKGDWEGIRRIKGHPCKAGREYCRICGKKGGKLSKLNGIGEHFFHSEPPDKRSEADISGKAEEME